MGLLQKLKIWIALTRPPFQVVGILPFIVGSLIPLYRIRVFDVPVFWWGLAGVVLVMAATYFNGEVHDIQEDQLSVKLEKNTFSGGTQVLVNRLVPLRLVNKVSYAAIGSAFLTAVILQFYYQTGPWTVPLVTTGIITGFYYSKPPLRWVRRGWGELFIGYSYGWLPVAVGAYLQTGYFDPLVNWISLPIICSAFNVILINEFPDYPADVQVNKKNLVVRFGKARCAFMYVGVALIGIATFFLSLTQGLPGITGLLYLPVGVFSCGAVYLMLKRKFNDRRMLERICLITYAVNVGTCVCFIAGMLVKP